mgnify:CR=1 FL=1
MIPPERDLSTKWFYQCIQSRYGFNPHHLMCADAVEFFIGQGCKVGLGGHLMGQKVTEQVAEMRSLPAGIDQRSPARHPDWMGPDDLSLKIQEIREATDYQIPIQLKLGASRVYDDVRMAAKCGPDSIYLDGAEGGTGAGPHIATEETGIPLMAAIPEARRALEDVGLADEIDLTFPAEITTAVLKDIRAQSPKSVCQMRPTNVSTNIIFNHGAPPFNDPELVRAVMLALDRQGYNEILYQGEATTGGALLPAPEGNWGMPAGFLDDVPGYSGTVAGNREKARAIMKARGYGPDKPLRIKVSTRNIPSYRDQSVILIDHLKHVYIQAELEPLDTSVWYNRLLKKDYAVGMNIQGVGIDDPDVVFYETYSCGSERNYTNYCSPEIEKLFEQQSRMTDLEARRKLVWEIDKKLQEDGARPVIQHDQGATCWRPEVKGVKLSVNTIYNHWRFEDVWLDR